MGGLVGRESQAGLAGERAHESRQGEEAHHKGCGQQEPRPTGDLRASVEHALLSRLTRGTRELGLLHIDSQPIVDGASLQGHLLPGTSGSPSVDGAGASAEGWVVREAVAGVGGTGWVL